MYPPATGGQVTLEVTPAQLASLTSITFRKGYLPSAARPFVINVLGSGPLSFEPPELNGMGRDRAGYVMWNLSAFDDVDVTGGRQLLGTVLAPNGAFRHTGAGNVVGTVIGASVSFTGGAGEIHVAPFNASLSDGSGTTTTTAPTTTTTTAATTTTTTGATTTTAATTTSTTAATTTSTARITPTTTTPGVPGDPGDPGDRGGTDTPSSPTPGTAGTRGDDELPRTGTGLMVLVALGLGLIAAGAISSLGSRKRSHRPR